MDYANKSFLKVNIARQSRAVAAGRQAAYHTSVESVPEKLQAGARRRSLRSRVALACGLLSLLAAFAGAHPARQDCVAGLGCAAADGIATAANTTPRPEKIIDLDARNT